MTLDKIILKISQIEVYYSDFKAIAAEKIVCRALSRGWTMAWKNAAHINVILIFLVDCHYRSQSD